MNVFDIVPITFVLDFDDEHIDENFTNFLKFYDKNAPS